MTQPTSIPADDLSPTADADSPVAVATRYRWVICTMLFLATTINYVDRQILSLLKPILDGQMHWTDTQFGLLNSAFQASYGISVIFFGWFVDRFGVKVGYAVSIGAWSLAAIGHALVNSLAGFFGARVALGLGEGGNFPAAIKATAQWFPRHERALATSLFNSGANVGAVLAPALVPVIAYKLGWHWTFVFAGLAGLVWLVVWMPILDVPRQSRRISPAELLYIESGAVEAADAPQIGLGDILKRRQAWSFIVAKFLTDPVWWFFLIWLPDFFKKTRHLDIKNSWTLLVSIYAIITVLSIFGGWLSGHLVNRGWSATAARKVSMAIFACCVLPIALATQVGDWTAVVLIGIAGAAHQAWSATLFTTVSDMFPKHLVAKIIGLGTSAGSLGGIGFPIAAGMVLDHFASGYTILFGICSGAYLVAFALHHLLAPRLEPQPLW
jgi:ACS family hexuronate transporter-like MFS transporter